MPPPVLKPTNYVREASPYVIMLWEKTHKRKMSIRERAAALASCNILKYTLLELLLDGLTHKPKTTICNFVSFLGEMYIHSWPCFNKSERTRALCHLPRLSFSSLLFLNLTLNQNKRPHEAGLLNKSTQGFPWKRWCLQHLTATVMNKCNGSRAADFLKEY